MKEIGIGMVVTSIAIGLTVFASRLGSDDNVSEDSKSVVGFVEVGPMWVEKRVSSSAVRWVDVEAGVVCYESPAIAGGGGGISCMPCAAVNPGVCN